MITRVKEMRIIQHVKTIYKNEKTGVYTNLVHRVDETASGKEYSMMLDDPEIGKHTLRDVNNHKSPDFKVFEAFLKRLREKEIVYVR